MNPTVNKIMITSIPINTTFGLSFKLVFIMVQLKS